MGSNPGYLLKSSLLYKQNLLVRIIGLEVSLWSKPSYTYCLHPKKSDFLIIGQLISKGTKLSAMRGIGVFQTEHIPNWANSISKLSTFNLLHIPNWAYSRTNLINSWRCIGYFSECGAATKKLLHTPLQRLETRHETCVRMFQQIEWYRDRTKSPCNS